MVIWYKSGNPTIFNGKDMYIFKWAYYHQYNSAFAFSPLPSLDRWAAVTKATGIRVLYLYCKNKKQLLCIQGTEGVPRQGWMRKHEHLIRPGSNHIYLVSGRDCLNMLGVAAGWRLPHQDWVKLLKGSMKFPFLCCLHTLFCLVNPTHLWRRLWSRSA